MADKREQLDQVWITGIRSISGNADRQRAMNAPHVLRAVSSPSSEIVSCSSSRILTPHTTPPCAWQVPLQTDLHASRTAGGIIAAEAQKPPVHLLPKQDGRSNQAISLTKFGKSCLSVLIEKDHTQDPNRSEGEAKSSLFESGTATPSSPGAVWQWSEEMLDLSPRELEAALATMPALRQDQLDQLLTARTKKRNRMYARRSRARKREIRLQQGLQKGYSQKIGALKMHNAALRSFLANSTHCIA
jgi:hypothetical protein